MTQHRFKPTLIEFHGDGNTMQVSVIDHLLRIEIESSWHAEAQFELRSTEALRLCEFIAQQIEPRE